MNSPSRIHGQHSPSVFCRALLLTLAATHANAAPTFKDVTLEAGVDYLQWNWASVAPEVLLTTGGAASADIDGDGYPDLYVTRLDAPDILFRNNQRGGFENYTLAAGLTADLPTNGAAFGDIDNDGDPDLYVTTVSGTSKHADSTRHYLYINDGAGHFTEQAAERNAAIQTATAHNGTSVALGDYDRDGYLDMSVMEWLNRSVNPPELNSHARLLRNLGSTNPGHFQDKTLDSGVYLDDSLGYGSAGPEHSSFGIRAFTPAFSDLDLDGHPDIAIAADFHTSRLYWNNGDGTFSQAPGPTDPNPSGIGTDENGMGSTIADFNGDGLLDWFVTSIFDPADTCANGRPCGWSATGNRLYLNNGDRTFTDATDEANVRDGGWGWGATALDYDNDGDLDLAMANGFLFPLQIGLPFHNEQTRLWNNDGTGVFTEVATLEGVTDTESGKGILTFDYDVDGDLDLFVVNNGGHPKLYQNNTDDTNASIKIELEGTVSNRDGIGAWITLIADPGGAAQYREISGGSNYLSQSDISAHFGLGPRTDPVHQITIRWPSGNIQNFFNIAVNGTLSAIEPVPEPSTVLLVCLAAVLFRLGVRKALPCNIFFYP